jgi:cytochrome b
MEATDDTCAARVKVWDLPTRLFHWGLATSVGAAIVTAKLGGNWMEWHLRFGLLTLVLLMFRLIWGVIGSRYARFSSLLYTPRAVLRYVSAGRQAPRHAGHSPSGAVAVIVFLTVLIVQAGTGLITSDAIDTDGPLVRFASDSQVSWASWVHVHMQWVIYALISLHVAAIATYLLYKRDNLIGAMITGWNRGLSAPPANDSWPVRLGGIVVLVVLGSMAFKLLT